MSNATEKSTRELMDRFAGYHGPQDAKFASLVHLMVSQMIEHKIAPDELRDAAFVASVKFLQMYPRDLIYRRDDLPDSDSVFNRNQENEDVG